MNARARTVIATGAIVFAALVASACALASQERAEPVEAVTEPLNFFADTTEAPSAEDKFNAVAEAIGAETETTRPTQPAVELPTTVDKHALATSTTPTASAAVISTTTMVDEPGDAPTTTPGTAPTGSIRMAPPFAWGVVDERPPSFPTDCDPAATIETRPTEPVLGEPFSVRIEATSSNGFDFLWLFSVDDPRPVDLNRSFQADFSDAPNHVWAEWSVTLHEPGIYEVGAQGRDVLYGTQPKTPDEIGNGIGNQVSEGCGIPFLDIVID